MFSDLLKESKWLLRKIKFQKKCISQLIALYLETLIKQQLFSTAGKVRISSARLASMLDTLQAYMISHQVRLESADGRVPNF